MIVSRDILSCIRQINMVESLKVEKAFRNNIHFWIEMRELFFRLNTKAMKMIKKEEEEKKNNYKM